MLVRLGVPYDVAFSLDPADRIAHLVVLGEYEGNTFDWSAGEWEQKDD